MKISEELVRLFEKYPNCKDFIANYSPYNPCWGRKIWKFLKKATEESEG